MKTKWLDRSLLMGGHLALVTNQAEYKRALKELNCEADDRFVTEGSYASTHCLRNTDGSIAHIVGIDKERAKDYGSIDVAALLVHEAVHVWQNTESEAGPMGCFGTEGEAYAIQCISLTLMREYAKRLDTQI